MLHAGTRDDPSVGGGRYQAVTGRASSGTITSTLLTLLVIPSFYDSIEIARDRAIAKYRRRAERWHAAPAFVMTLLEAVLTLLLLRALWRAPRRLWRRLSSRRGAAAPLPGAAAGD